MKIQYTLCQLVYTCMMTLFFDIYIFHWTYSPLAPVNQCIKKKLEKNPKKFVHSLCFITIYSSTDVVKPFRFLHYVFMAFDAVIVEDIYAIDLCDNKEVMQFHQIIFVTQICLFFVDWSVLRSQTGLAMINVVYVGLKSMVVCQSKNGVMPSPIYSRFF